jgi:hypothetical protein
MPGTAGRSSDDPRALAGIGRRRLAVEGDDGGSGLAADANIDAGAIGAPAAPISADSSLGWVTRAIVCLVAFAYRLSMTDRTPGVAGPSDTKARFVDTDRAPTFSMIMCQPAHPAVASASINVDG